MKKSIKWLVLVSLLLIVVMSFALVSCGNENDDTDTDTNTDTDTDTEQGQTSYTITFKQADGTEDEVTVNAGETVTVPTAKQVDGYSVAWETTDFSNISSDMTVNAKKTAIEYTITYELDGGDNNTNNPAKYTIETATIALSNPTKTGYKFLGWYSDAELTTAVTEIALGSKGNVTLYAGWELVQYTITYETNGGTNAIGNPSKYTLSANDITIEPATRAGYDFVGWYSDIGYSTKVEAIKAGTTGNITLYAKYDLERFEIIYNLNGGKNKDNPADFNKEEAVTFKDASRNGYTFNGWYSDRECTVAVTGIAKGTEGAVTVYAKWTPIVYELDYEVYDKGEKNPENPTSYTVESVYDLLPPLNVKEGYTFAGWFINGAFSEGSELTSISAGTMDVPKLYAKYEATSYNITYELAGGTNADTNPTTYTVENVGENKITLADPTFAGAKFLGWYVGEEKVTEVPATVGGVTITAKWEYITYNIEYVLNQVGATNASSNLATYSRDKDFALAAPIKENVNFIAWYLDPEFTTKVEQTSELVGNVTLYAKWSPALSLTKDDMEITQQNANYNGGNLTAGLLDGATECADIYGWSQIDWYINKHSSQGTETLTITLNNPTTISGFKIYSKAAGADFEMKLLDADGNEILAKTLNVGDHMNTNEIVYISSYDGITYENVKTITITCKSLSKPFRISEVVVEVQNPAYEAPAAE